MHAGWSVGQTTQPTQAAAADSPKSTIKSLVTAMSTGDAAAMRDLLYANTASDQKLVAAMTDTAVAVAELNRGMAAKFGAEQAKAVMGDPADVVKQTVDSLDKAQEQVDGDSAKVVTGNTAQGTMSLKKIDGKWKVDVAAYVAGKSPEQVDQTLGSVNHGIGVFKELLADVNAGKFKTAEEAKAAMSEKLSPPSTSSPTTPQLTPTPGTPSPVTPSPTTPGQPSPAPIK